MSAAPELPFHLQGNFAPVEQEVTATDLPVEGALPTELRGLYARNGSNPITGHSEHWFLGEGMVHGVRLEGGRAVWYRNRYVKTPRLENPKLDRISPEGEMDRSISYANTHVLAHAGRILALEEGSFPYVLDGELETLGCDDFGGRLKSAMTAHPKICPVTGELVFFGYGQLPPYLVYHRLSPEGKLVQSEEIAVTGPTMMHDFAVSERHAIFMDLPVIFDLEAALRGEMPFRWSDDYPARMGVMPRDGNDAQVKWFEVDPCYVFHTVNAFDDGDRVVLDACRISQVWRNPGEFASDADQTLHRFSFDPASGKVSETTLDERAMDFPRVADARVGQKHRFAYTAAIGDLMGEGERSGRLYKIDLEGSTSAVHDFGSGRLPGEGVFVPAEGSGSDEEGWVMTFVYDEGTNSSEFVVLDATDFAARPVARVALPQRVPFGFHGSWIGDPT